SNKGKGNYYEIIKAEIEIEANQVLSYDYMVSSEAGRDLLYVLVNGDIVNGGGWSATGDDWKQADVYVSEKKEKVELAFIYQKDDADPDQSDPEAPRIGDDEARIRDIHLYDVAGIERPTDIMRACASGEITADRKYSHYVTPVYSEADGLYHKDSKDGPIIYMTISQFTPWSNLHTGNITDGNDYYNTLYNMTYFGYHTGEGSSFNVVLDGTNITDRLISYWTIQRYMESPFYLLPVNEQLKEWAEKFAIQYERDAGNTAHNNEWLEFCYYYQHYGNAHEEGETCKSNTDLTFGLTPYNSFTAYEKSDPARLTAKTYNEDTNRFRVDVRYPFERNNGNYYKFTATKAGVYQLRSYTTNCSTQNAVPDIAVYEKNGERYRMILSGGFVRDFDRVKGTANYEGFNEYISLEAGQEVYMLLLSSHS
ncbi:MAG: hypothetical protein K2O54_04090, partial [Prevotella sp.]|nr:hypothetical protein [Prevotella sp.]